MSALGQTNLGFEEPGAEGSSGLPLGWTLAGARLADATIATDERAPAEGALSLRVALGSNGAVRLVQRVAAADLAGPREATGRRLRLSGYARTEGAEASPALWLRIDGAKGPLFLDSSGAAAEGGEGQEPTAPRATSRDWRRYELELPWPADVTEVALGISARGAGDLWFDGLRLEGLPAPAAPPAPSAVRYLDDALALMREHSLAGRSVDWPSLRAAALAYLGDARHPADAHLAVRFALRELGDRHSYLQGPAVVRALEATAVANALTRQPAMAPSGRRLPGEWLYLTVPGFAGGTHGQQIEFAENIKKVIQDLDSSSSCGWIVDLRDNRGGNLWPMLVGLGPLLGEGELAASVYPDGRRVSVWYREGRGGFGDYVQLRVNEPYRPRSDAPIAVLIGPGTASSAEVLVVAFHGRAGVRTFGAATSGVSAGNRIFSLADGASLVLTVAATSDRFGRIHAGPIEPDQTVARGGPREVDSTLQAALGWLETAAACR